MSPARSLWKKLLIECCLSWNARALTYSTYLLRNSFSGIYFWTRFWMSFLWGLIFRDFAKFIFSESKPNRAFHGFQANDFTFKIYISLILKIYFYWKLNLIFMTSNNWEIEIKKSEFLVFSLCGSSFCIWFFWHLNRMKVEIAL